MAHTLSAIRKEKGYRQQDVAEYLGIPQSTYAYKESSGTFDDLERSKIAKYLKVDMNTITWTSSVQSKGVTDDRDSIIRQQQEQIIKLEAELKLLKELYQNLLQTR